jgi:hypothetical protein
MRCRFLTGIIPTKKSPRRCTGVRPGEVSSVLESIAAISNINLGENEARIAANISSIRANEIARTSLIAAKKRVADQAQGTVMEDDRGNTEENKEGEAIGTDTDKQKVEEVGSERPPKKPPKQTTVK